MPLVVLTDVALRSNDTRAIKHTLSERAGNLVSPKDLTGWTIELYLGGTLVKTIDAASDPDADGRIENQTTDPGKYFFVLAPADLAPFAKAAPGDVNVVNAYVRYVTPEAAPPRTFSDVEFKLQLKTA